MIRAMTTKPAPGERYKSFRDFYPFYIHEHSNRTCRRIHVVGSALVLVIFGMAIFTRNPWWLLGMPLVGYGFAWVGHFFFERNRPATFKYPLWSLMGDWRMFFEVVSGQRKF
ncbi:MAG: DUF962 domain-containing protein [Hyphomonadaceae bacterium]